MDWTGAEWRGKALKIVEEKMKQPTNTPQGQNPNLKYLSAGCSIEDKPVGLSFGYNRAGTNPAGIYSLQVSQTGNTWQVICSYFEVALFSYLIPVNHRRHFSPHFDSWRGYSPQFLGKEDRGDRTSQRSRPADTNIPPTLQGRDVRSGFVHFS